jgi:uncharacterized protein YndB with AHSA1/START domain
MTATDVRDGVLERLPDGRRRLRFERVLSHPVERVWAALTQPGELGGWWGDAELDLREGGEFVMRWRNTDPEGNHPVMHATITALDPPSLLELSGDLHGVLRWELSPSGPDATLLRFSSTLEIPTTTLRARSPAGTGTSTRWPRRSRAALPSSAPSTLAGTRCTSATRRSSADRPLTGEIDRDPVERVDL